MHRFVCFQQNFPFYIGFHLLFLVNCHKKQDFNINLHVFLIIIVAFLENATIEYSLESLCVCPCLCVCVCLHENSIRN